MAASKTDTSVQEDQSNAAARRARGEFVRGVSGFRHAIGDADFPAESGRYHLFVALNCPWCHRVTLARNVLGLSNAITLDVALKRSTFVLSDLLGFGLLVAGFLVILTGRGSH